MNKREYEERVRMIARNGLKMGESPRFIAETMVVDTENVGDEKAILHAAEPFVDDPSTQTRLYPKDVLRLRGSRISSSMPDDLRSLAVELLKRDVYNTMMEIENSTLQRL